VQVPVCIVWLGLYLPCTCVICVLKIFTEEVLTHQTDLHNITTCAKRFSEFAKVTEFSCFDIYLHFRFCWIHTFYLNLAGCRLDNQAKPADISWCCLGRNQLSSNEIV